MFNTKDSRSFGEKLIILFLAFTVSLFSQGWNNVVQTTIQFDNLVGLDLVTNKDGNHILVNNHNISGGFPVVSTHTLKYYLISSSGTVIRSYTFEDFQGGQGIQFASIDGADDRIYVVYKLWNGNQIVTRKTTNAGQSWTNIADINIGNNTCNHVDIVFGKDDNALHVVWATQDNGNDYETYYRRLFDDQWETQKNVTDYGNEVGGFPTVSKSNNKVHVSYNTGQSWDPETNLGDAKSRDKYTSTWQTPQLVFPTESFRERIHAGSSKLFDFYYKIETGMGQYHSDLYVKERSLTGTSWSSPILLKSFAGVREIVSAINTFDGNSHIVYEIGGAVGYRKYNGSTWGSEENIGDGYFSPRIYSVSNDLFVVWGREAPNQNIRHIYYRQFDAAPLAPKNLTISINTSEETVLNWNPNTEPDVRITGGKYRIYRAETDLNGNILPYQLVATINAMNGNSPISSWIDTEAGKSKTRKLYYKITAVDVNQHESLYSNEVWRWGRILKSSSGVFVNDFDLKQNYPNPFNPTTKISWQSPVNGQQTLKVYDVLGREVATLVDEYREAGSYEVEFDATNLPSGMYIYRMQSGSYSDVKKMILSK